jgi:hypothetical protein
LAIARIGDVSNCTPLMMVPIAVAARDLLGVVRSHGFIDTTTAKDTAVSAHSLK